MKAYPFLHKHPTTGNTTMSDGMDLRDWFAGLAMQAFVSAEDFSTKTDIEFAYEIADAMMKQRELPHE
jgi:hypothetical protein